MVRRATLVTTNIPLVGTLGPGTIRAFFRAILGAFSSGSISLKIRSNKKAATDLKLMECASAKSETRRGGGLEGVANVIRKVSLAMRLALLVAGA